MIRTGIANAEPLLEGSIYQEYLQKIPRWRQEKAERLIHPADRALSVGAWILYEMLQKEYQVSEQAVFNLSHSGKYVLCSLDSAEVPAAKVGCDIEKPGRDQERIAERFFTSAECRYIREAAGAVERKERFYRLWVLKESYVKAVRRGLGLGLHNFQFAFTAENTPYISVNRTGIAEQYFFKEYTYLRDAGAIAVCSTSPDFSEELFIGTMSI